MYYAIERMKSNKNHDYINAIIRTCRIKSEITREIKGIDEKIS